MSYTEWYCTNEESVLRTFMDLPESIRDEVTVDDVASQTYEDTKAYQF